LFNIPVAFSHTNKNVLLPRQKIISNHWKKELIFQIESDRIKYFCIIDFLFFSIHSLSRGNVVTPNILAINLITTAGNAIP